MKQVIQKILTPFWHYANTNVGSVLIGAGVAYLFTKGSREEEIRQMKQLIESKDRKLNKQDLLLQESTTLLQKSAQNNFDLLNDKVAMQADLECSQRQKTLLRYAFDNSTCFFRHIYSEDNVNPAITTAAQVNKSQNKI